jgi:hypothetical protein
VFTPGVGCGRLYRGIDVLYVIDGLVRPDFSHWAGCFLDFTLLALKKQYLE